MGTKKAGAASRAHGAADGAGLLGARIKALRTEHEWTLVDLAYLAGTHTSAISEIENGKREVRTDTLRRLAMTLETSSDYLIGLTDDPKPRTK
jgi:transcriptional regulator with XRE-family HTH domain